MKRLVIGEDNVLAEPAEDISDGTLMPDDPESAIITNCAGWRRGGPG